MNLFQLYCKTYRPKLEIPELSSFFQIKDILTFISEILNSKSKQLTIVSDYDADGVFAYKIADYYFLF